MQYRKRQTFEAVQWFVVGDHADVFDDGSGLGRGVIALADGPREVLPGDWIVSCGEGVCVVAAAQFEAEYEPAADA